nr:retrovirus-related Pol polyprotein from transposon TNT 1-94 [Tanacetum cinerariifolium]
MGTFRETLAESIKGTPQFGSERPQVYSDLNSEEKDRYNADIRAKNILLQGLPNDIYTLINHYTDAKDIWNNVNMLLEGSELTKEDRESQLYDDFEHFRQHMVELIHEYYVRFAKLINDIRNIKMTMSKLQAQENRVALDVEQLLFLAGHIVRNCTQPKRPQNSKYFKDKMLLIQAQENRVALDAEQLLFLAGGQDNVFDDDVDEQPVQDLALNVDNVFQADDCDGFDSNVDEAPTAQTMFMANLSSTDLVTNEVGPSYDSDILFEVPDYEHYLDAASAHHEGHVMYDNIQLDHFVDPHADYTSDSHMIPYDQYVMDNEVPVLHSGASSILTNTFMMIYDDMFEPHEQSVCYPSRNTAVQNSLTAELATYREHVKLYEQQAKFELTEREQKINV